MMITETQRLYIRELNHDDTQGLATILTDPEVMKYSIRGVSTPEGIRSFINNCIENYRAYGYSQWAVFNKNSDELIGVCGLNPFTLDAQDIVHINYRFARAHQGRGFALEAVNGVLEYAFEHLKVDSIKAIIEPDNLPSIKLAEKAGFIFVKEALFYQRPTRIFDKTA
jgi:RimJ/RimL family protein N-acetyltransferase